MTRLLGVVAVVGIGIVGTVVSPDAARAQGTWHELASEATEVESGHVLAALFWAQHASCSKIANDLEARQCRLVRDARKEQVAGGTYVMNADARALSTESKPKLMKLKLKLYGCLACDKPVDVDGRGMYVIAGKGAAKVKGGAVRGPSLGSMSITVKTKRQLQRFDRAVAKRLRSELVFKISDKAATWKSGNVSGFKVDVLGYRVYDPCDGKVYMASVKSGTAPADKRYCSGDPVVDKPIVEKPTGPKKPKLPRQLTPSQIRDALRPATLAGRQCFDAYGVAGVAKFRISFSGKGDVVAAKQTGDFVDTPTGTCIAKAVNAAKFLPSRRRQTTIDFPFILR